MAANESRTLNIRAALQDAASAGFRKLQAAAVSSAKGIALGFGAASRALTSTRAVITGLVATIGTRRLASGFLQILDGLDHIGEVTEKLGVTTESLTAIRFAASSSGIEIDKLADLFAVFARNASKATSGGKEQKAAFRELGISAEQLTGTQIDMVGVLAQVADGMESVRDQTDRTRLLVELFGKSGADLQPLLQGGGDAIRRLAQEAKQLGGVISRDEIAKARQFQDSLDNLKASMQALIERVVIDLAPAFAEASRNLQEFFLRDSGNVRKALVDLAGVVVKVAGVFQDSFYLVRKSLLGLELVFELAKRTGLVLRNLAGDFTSAFENEKEIEETSNAIRELDRNSAEAAKRLGLIEDALRNIRANSEVGITIPLVVDKKPDRDVESAVQDSRFTDPEILRDLQKPPPVDAWLRFRDGVDAAARSYADLGKAAFDAGNLLVSGPLDALSDALAAGISRTKSWADAWRDFGRQTIQILAQVIAKLTIAKTLSTIFPSLAGDGGGFRLAKGGVLPGSVLGTLPLRRYAMGGIARGPELALIGEGRAPGEAFVPLPDGRTIPVSWHGGAPVGNHTTNIYISAMDSKDVTRVLSRQRGLLRAWSHDDLDRRHQIRQQVQRVVR